MGKLVSQLRNQWMGALALFLVLAGGTAWAGQQLAKDSVDSRAIQTNAVKDPELANNAVDSGEVENGSLLRSDFGAGQLPQDPEFSEFYALMPPDNAATVAAGSAVDFPQDGPSNGGITRADEDDADDFVLAEVGTYRVAFIVSVTEPGQLAVRLNGTELSHTVFGRATGTSQIVGEALVTTATPNSAISVVNPSSNPTALTITPLAGGTQPTVASLVIQQLR